MMMNEEPVRVAIQQSTQMIEETLAANMRRFKSGSTKRRDVRRKRSTREGDNQINNNLFNQGKFYTEDNSYYRYANGLDKVPPQFQYPFAHYNHQQQYQLPQQHQIHFQQQQQFHFQQQQHQQQQQQQVPPTSPLQITPPISSSHPLSSFQIPNQPTPVSNGHPLYMCPSQVQMPMQFPVPMSFSMPPANYDGSITPMPIQMPLQMPLQMPIHMPNMPLPMFIRLPAPPCVSPASSNSSEDNFKSNLSTGGVGSPAPTNTGTVVNFIPLMFPPHLGPMLLGPSQPVMVTRMPGSSNFHQMVNENQHRLSTHQHQQSQSSIK